MGIGEPDTLAIGASQSWGRSPVPPSTPGRVELRGLSDGELTCEATGTFAGDSFGSAVCALGDVDGDGFPELAVGAPQAGRERDVPSHLPGYVALISSKDGSFLWTVAGSEGTRRFGTTIARIGDVDGDGLADLVVGAAGPSEAVWAPGAILGLSARTGEWLFEAVEEGPLVSIGSSLASAGDLDSDGLDDALATGLRAPLSQGSRDVDVLVMSAATGSLRRFGSVRNASIFSEFALAVGRWRNGNPRIAVGMASSVSGESGWRMEVLDESGSRSARFEPEGDPVDGVAVDWCAFQQRACIAVLTDEQSKRDSTWLVGVPGDPCWGYVAVFDGVLWNKRRLIREQDFARSFRPR